MCRSYSGTGFLEVPTHEIACFACPCIRNCLGPAWGTGENACKTPDTYTVIKPPSVSSPWWGNYFRTGNADREFNMMELYAMGLHRLMSTVQYPAQATPRRSSLSRVSENGTHSLKGDAMETGQPR